MSLIPFNYLSTQTNKRQTKIKTITKITDRSHLYVFNNILQLRLEDRERENASLTRQLENALTDLRRQQDQYREKQAGKVSF